jgi:hypothetical protein
MGSMLSNIDKSVYRPEILQNLIDVLMIGGLICNPQISAKVTSSLQQYLFLNQKIMRYISLEGVGRSIY